MRPPGFEPGFPALSIWEWEAGVIDQAARQLSELSADSGPRPLLRLKRATLSKRFLRTGPDSSRGSVRFNYLRQDIAFRISVRTLPKLIAIAGFFLIVGPGLLAINGLLDNTTFTALFIVGFVLVIVSSSNRVRSSQSQRKLG